MTFSQLTDELLRNGTIERLKNVILESMDDAREVARLMSWLLLHRVEVANEILCTRYDVWCYQVCKADFSMNARLEDLNKWFASIPASWSIPDDDAFFKEGLFETEALAQAHAVKTLKLDELFLNAQAAAREAETFA